jgi:hypothetical protein
MQYTVRAFVGGRDERLDGMCRTFSSMERTAYNLLREGAKAGDVKATLRGRYGVMNARWCQSAMNQAKAVVESQEEGIRYRVEQCREKAKNMKVKMGRLSKPLKVEGCKRRMEKYESKAMDFRKQLEEKSYPQATFGSDKLLHQLSIARGERKEQLRQEWRERRSNHFFSVGQANQRGNGNARLSHNDQASAFDLELRNWPGGDLMLLLRVPEHWTGLLKNVIRKAETKKLAYSVRVVRSLKGYQVLVSFELDEPAVQWSGRLAGIDINPEGVACSVVSSDGNLIVTRFLRDSRLITASKNKRKWVLENLVNRMLKWCRDTRGCNAIAVESLQFKGAYDSSPRTNFRLSNFMKRKMLQTVGLHALKMNMLSVNVGPAYTSLVAIAKYGKKFGGFNRHQLAAFVIARRALGYGETPALDCLPGTRKERTMWNHCARYYGHQPRIRTLLHHEPMEWKSDGDVNGGGVMTKLFTAPPADTSSQMGLSHAPEEGAETVEIVVRRAGRASPNGHTNRGDWARGRRTHPPDDCVRQQLSSPDKEDNEIC